MADIIFDDPLVDEITMPWLVNDDETAAYFLSLGRGQKAAEETRMDETVYTTLQSVDLQKYDWVTFAVPTPDHFSTAHVLSINDHGLIQFAWGERDFNRAHLHYLPVSTGLVTDAGYVLTGIWRRNNQGEWQAVPHNA